MSRLAETITLPAAVDVHDHFREPSPLNKSENFESGTRAALLGGYIVTCDMPNTPGRPTWTYNAVLEKKELISKWAQTYVGIIAGSQPGESNNEDNLGSLADSCLALKFYMGKTTGNKKAANLKVDDFEYTVQHWHKLAPKKPIMVHLGDIDPLEVIDLIAKKYKHPLHLCHVNNPRDVHEINKAKTKVKSQKKRWRVTTGVCPHHLFMTSHEERTKGWQARMQPPLAEQMDVEKLWFQLNDGQIDIIETDHAPHPIEKKWQAEEENPDGLENHQTTCFGVPGIEFAIPQLLNQVRLGHLSPERLEEITSSKPAEIIGIKLHPRTTTTWSRELYQIGEQDIASKSKMSPYLGNLAVGRVILLKTRHKQLVKDNEVVDTIGFPLLKLGQTV